MSNDEHTRFHLVIFDLTKAESLFFTTVTDGISEEKMVDDLPVDHALRPLLFDEEAEGIFNALTHLFEGIAIKVHAEFVHSDYVVFDSDEVGDPHILATLLQAFLSTFPDRQPIWFQTVTTCECGCNEFSGKGYYVTSRGFDILTTSDIQTKTLIARDIVQALRLGATNELLPLELRELLGHLPDPIH